jgi:hypothetical protein
MALVESPLESCGTERQTVPGGEAALDTADVSIRRVHGLHPTGRPSDVSMPTLAPHLGVGLRLLSIFQPSKISQGTRERSPIEK